MLYYNEIMREFQERRFFRKIIFSKFAFIFLSIVLAFVFYSTVKIYLRSREAAFVNDILKKETEGMISKKNDLSAVISRLESAEGEEEEIRKRFPVQKPGEKSVIIIEENPKADLGSQSEESFFQKVRQFAKKIF